MEIPAVFLCGKQLLTKLSICSRLKLSIKNRQKKEREQNMPEMKLGEVESRFADIIWSNEPVASGELAKICAGKLSWKRTTTYNVLRKLCDKGIFQNQSGIVSSLVSKQEFYAAQGETIVEEAFDGSLPAFIAAFTKRKALSAGEIEEIKRMIDTAGEV